MTNVSAVLFDLDETICDYVRPSSDVLRVAFERVGVDPFFDVTEYFTRYGTHVPTTDTVEELREVCFADLAEENGLERDVGVRVAREFSGERDHQDVVFMPGAKEALDALATEYPIGLVTNGAPGMQREKLASLDIESYFDVIVYAGYDAASKPDPEPFEVALDTLGVGPGAAVHVGNSLDADVAGAHAVGARSAWLVNGFSDLDPDPVPTYRLESMHELVTPPWL